MHIFLTDLVYICKKHINIKVNYFTYLSFLLLVLRLNVIVKIRKIQAFI